MANINISDYSPAGADLFLDSESYLNDLTEGEMTNTLGGWIKKVVRTTHISMRLGGIEEGDQYRFRTVSTILSYLS
jgi:hypothetical protein